MTFRTLVTFGFACALIVSACSSGQDIDARIYVQGLDSPSPSASQLRDVQVQEIFADASQKNEQKLVTMRRQQVQAGSSPDPVIALSLYTLDQTKYQPIFVSDYPQDVEGVVDDYGRRFGAAGLNAAGSGFPIAQLGGIAATGNMDAQKKLLGALSHSAGSPVERDYQAQVERAAQSAPASFLTVFASVPMPIRLAVMSETDWCYHRPDSLLSAQPSAAPNAVLVASEFRSSLDDECRRLAEANEPKARPARRHAKHRVKGGKNDPHAHASQHGQ